MQSDSPNQPTVGATFSEARQALGISPIEAADLLNLTLRTIEALEADDYESLPGRVYVNGYVRAYAKMLGLDADELIRRYTASQEDSDEPPLGGNITEPEPRHYVNKMPLSLTLKQWGYVAVGCLALVLFLSFFEDIPRPTSQPIESVRASIEAQKVEPARETLSAGGADELGEPESSSLVAAGTEATVVAAPDAVPATTIVPAPVDATPESRSDAPVLVDDESVNLASTNQANGDGAEVPMERPNESASTSGEVAAAEFAVSIEPVGETETEADTEADTEAATETGPLSELADEESVGSEYQVPYLGQDESGARRLSVAGDTQLRYEFSADCWIEIRRVDDTLLYADLGRAGEVRRFVGESPFKLKIGFAEGVRLFFDAEEVELAPYTRNQMARLELPQ